MKSIKKKVMMFGVFTAIFLALQLNVFGQTSRISGRVMGADRSPVADVYVELLNEVESVLNRVRTNSSGSYSFIGLSGGRFVVRVRPFGTDYEEQSREVEIVTYVAGRQIADDQQVDFFLRVRKDSKSQPAAAGVVFYQEIPPDAQKAYDQAMININANRIEPGLLDLQKAITIFPTYFTALDQLGVQLMKQGKFNDAIAYFERAAAVNERSRNSWYGLAICYYSVDNSSKAVESGKKASTFDPASPQIALVLGMSLRKDKQFKEAETALKNAKKFSKGKMADAYWNLALLYAYNLKNYKLAAEELEAFLKIEPSHPDAQLLRKYIEELKSQK
ncbi:MAG TPA: tetratricopeptide repeat protein [Pyrinomonadaceae bacterium]|nr:tetratricopeptide repeat protein [Pyrinomonadaceae bacterium]